MQITDKWIRKQVAKWIKIYSKNPIPRVPYYKLQDIGDKITELKEEDIKEPDNWWVYNGHLYTTGRYRTIVEKLNKDAEKKDQPEENQ